MSQYGLKAVVRRHIVEDMVRSVNQTNGGKWKVLVVDQAALRIISAVTNMNELTDENITLIEPLEKRRQPYAAMEAIYLCRPSADSVNRIIEDFTASSQNKTGQLYLGAHLFFTGQVDDRLFHRLKSSQASKHIKTLRELYLDYLVVESQVFVLERPWSMLSFYGSEVASD